MRKILTAAMIAGALSAVPVAASAQDRLVNGALGAGAGALVGGPVGAVVGGAIGWGAGRQIGNALGVNGHRYHRRHYHRRAYRHRYR